MGRRARAASQPDFFTQMLHAIIRGVHDHCGPETTVETNDTSAFFVVDGRAEYEIHVTEADVVRVCRRIVKKLELAFQYRAAVTRRGGQALVRLSQFGEPDEERAFDLADPGAAAVAAAFVLGHALEPLRG
jgi:hypothetical protein